MNSFARRRIHLLLKNQSGSWAGNFNNVQHLGLQRVNVFAQPIVADKHPESFHCAVSTILSVAQFFGILPVYGVRSDSPERLAFRLLSLRSIYALVVATGIFILSIFSICHFVLNIRLTTADKISNYELREVVSTIFFYLNGFLGIMFFLRLSPQWISVQRHWRETERLLNKLNNQRPSSLRRKILVISGTTFSLAFVEHVTGTINLFYPEQYFFTTANETFENIIRTGMQRNYPFLFSLVEYNYVWVTWLLFINMVAGFAWNFNDVFVMVISIGLTEHYKGLNNKVIKLFSTYDVNIDWHEVRENYAALSMLVKRVDDAIAPITWLSIVNDFFFICLHLFIGLSTEREQNYAFWYFIGSFAFLVGRTTAMILIAAQIDEHSKVVLSYMFTCPGSAFNTEAQRLQHQLAIDNVCLTGMRFFSITRNFLLTVAGSIVTYELVLFNSSN